MPEAGKFFISLGLVGAEKTLSGLAQVNDHFGGLKKMSTEAKLAILAALAGMEQLVSAGGKFGSQMTMLHQHLNVSTQDLIKYGNAAKIAGASQEDMYSTFDKIQSVLESIHIEGKASQFFPQIMALIQQSGENITKKDLIAMGNQPGGDVKFFNLMRRMINNNKVNQYDLYKMISDSGMMSTSIYDISKMGNGSIFDKALRMAPTVSNENVAKLNTLHMTWQQTLERFETALQNFAANPILLKLVQGLDSFADASNRIVNSLPKNSQSAWTLGGYGPGAIPQDFRDVMRALNIRDHHLVQSANIYIQANSSDTANKVHKALRSAGFETRNGSSAAKMTPTVAK